MTAINQPSTSSPVTIVAGDELFINSDVNVVTTSVTNAAIRANGDSGADIFNFGTIFAIAQTGIDWDVPEGNIYNAGLIGGGNFDNKAIDLLEDYVEGLLTITNTATGLIAGQIAIDETGAAGSSPETGEVRVINNGEINVPGSVFPSSTHYGVEVDGAFSIFVLNTGTITADEGIYARTQGADDNVPIIRNSGIIDARIFDGIDYQNVSTTTAGLIENSGTVSSATDNAIETSGLVTVRNTSTGLVQGDVDMAGTFNGTNQLWNAGVIIGEVQTGTGENRVTNTGTIEGDLRLEDQVDLYIGFGGGVVTGLLDAGFGDDTLKVEQNDLRIDGGLGTDVVFARSDVLDLTNVEEIRLLGDGGFTVQGGAGGEVINGNLGGNQLSGNGGADEINGGAGDDVISGGDQNDTLLGSTGDDEISGDLGEDSIRGGAGNDTLNGGADNDSVVGDGGNDEINGNFGDDTLNGAFGDDTIDGGGNDDFVLGLFGADLLLGGAGNDTLQGGTQNDTLLGGDGEDILAGGSGDDRIEAGLGRDIALGGTGNDVFVYNSVAEIDDGVDDRIKDFTVGDDLIDVSNIDEEASFTFIGTGAFTGGGDMEIRYFQNAFGATFLQFDENGDGASDGQLILLNTPGAVTADDFVL